MVKEGKYICLHICLFQSVLDIWLQFTGGGGIWYWMANYSVWGLIIAVYTLSLYYVPHSRHKGVLLNFNGFMTELYSLHVWLIYFFWMSLFTWELLSFPFFGSPQLKFCNCLLFLCCSFRGLIKLDERMTGSVILINNYYAMKRVI